MMFRNRWLWVTGAFIAVILLSRIVYVYHSPAPTFALTVPNPNGYDDFIGAAKMRTNVSVDVPSLKETNFSVARAEQYVKDCRPVLDRVRVGLAKQTAVPIVFTTNWMNEQVEMLPQTKKLEMTLVLEGYLFEHEEQISNAAKCYVDALKFGSAIARGGLLIDCLVSIANENIGVSAFETVVPKLSQSDCRYVLSELQQWQTNREPFETISARERKWADVYGRLVMGPVQLAIYNISRMIKTRSLHPDEPMIAKVRLKYLAVTDRVEALRVRVASRAFELDHKTAPKAWSDLVPAYLSTIPTNSATGRPLTYPF